MDIDHFLEMLRSSLASIRHPRYYETERGFQGELLAEIRKRLPELQIQGAVVEQEYQKRIQDHGFRIRPDIIIHVPFELSELLSRTEGNFLVIEPKLDASADEALCAYQHLCQMCRVLDYPLAVFINIGSLETFWQAFQNPRKNRLHSFGVRLEGNRVVINEQQTP